MDLVKRVGGMLANVAAEQSSAKKGEKKMSKRILVGALVGMMMMSGVAMAATESATTVSIEITVTCAPAASVWIGNNTYAFGSLGANTPSVAMTSIAVDNNSSGLTEKYALRASDARNNGAHATPTDWNLVAKNAESSDAYSLCARFNATRPADGDFAAANGDLANDNQNCNNTLFGAGGYNKASTDAPEHLWFRIKTPTSVTDTQVHTVFVTIVALGM